MRKSSRYLIMLVVLTALIAAGTVATWLARPRGWTGNLEGYPVTACPYHFEYEDFDNDGKTDLMTFGFMGMGAGNVHVYFGPLTRVRGWRRSHPFSRFWKNVGLGAELDPLFGCLLVTATDYNNDGFTDFVGSLFSFGVTIWMKNKDGRTFEQDNSPVVPEHLVSEAEGRIRRIRFPDLNGDGAADLFAQLEQGKGVIALRRKGGGFSRFSLGISLMG